MTKREAPERRRDPVVGDDDHAAVSEHRCKAHTHKLHQPEPVRYGPDRYVCVIDDRRTVHPNLKALLVAAEPPRQRHATGKSDAGAIVLFKISRRRWRAAFCQVIWGCDHDDLHWSG